MPTLSVHSWGDRTHMSDSLVNLFASRFVARRDVRAIQHADGSWAPDTANGRRDGERIPWDRAAFEAHLSSQKTYGHYLLDTDDTCKLFAFDVDLEKNNPDTGFTGYLPSRPMPTDGEEAIRDWEKCFVPTDARLAWRDRSHVGRDWMKLQFRMIAHKLVSAIEHELGIPACAAYSGNKGIHVYGFTGRIPAADARDGAMIVLDSLGNWSPSRGTNFFRCTDLNAVSGYPNLSIEVFPKQASLDGKDLGNLMRLPLGKHQKAPDPTFFIDLKAPMNVLKPIDPEWALSTASQFT